MLNNYTKYSYTLATKTLAKIGNYYKKELTEAFSEGYAFIEKKTEIKYPQ